MIIAWVFPFPPSVSVFSFLFSSLLGGVDYDAVADAPNIVPIDVEHQRGERLVESGMHTPT